MVDKAYRSGTGRNPGEEYLRSHTYKETDEGLVPMCGYGWNRAGGEAFSIFRGSPGTEGDCLICQKNVRAGKPPVANGWPHKTRWI